MNSSAEGRLHRYWPERSLTLFEYLPPYGEATRGSSATPNTLIFIAGLGDGFLSVPYVSMLASYVNLCPDWSLMEIQMSSSGLGWGTGDLHRDTEEIAKAVKYVRERSLGENPQGGNVVLMGHSTGSQNILHYLYYYNPKQTREHVNGAILQAAVSDREGLAMMRLENEKVQQAYEECLRISLNSEAENHQDKVCTLPPELASVLGWTRGLVSCKRFLSLASPFSPIRPELDDLFSSDLSDDTLRSTFGTVGKLLFLNSVNEEERDRVLLFLLSENDEYTPMTVDKKKLLRRWASWLKSRDVFMAQESGVIAGASHNVKEQEAQFDLVGRVFKYLDSIVGGIPKSIPARLDKERLEFLESESSDDSKGMIPSGF
jgi:pimeloyl-ACP methyl ester carboxylesterase